ncbi:MAG: inorganic phosphate transporter [Candidatus Ancillula sp.]|jgi:PiT family inorganic phosphate transporter|nr:inorganic phosphate transporter [Candidatus Ancillula sp.]
MILALAIAVIVVALSFDFTNGFNDAANAIATSVSTRALKPRAAFTLAAGMNLVGALLGTAVATTIAKEIIHITMIDPEDQLIIIVSALLGAITWNLTTWYLGMPSSSSHSLIGGLVGAGFSASLYHPEVHVQWIQIVYKVIEPMLFSPIIGFTCAFIVMTIFQWVFRKRNPGKTFSAFKKAQIFSSAALALGHGLQDAQKSMGIIFMAAAAAGIGGITHADSDIPLWIKCACAGAIGLGTFVGGKKIMTTLGSKIVDVDPARGFAAESVSAIVLYVTAFFIHAPISTSHTVTSSILGSGATKSMRSVNWGTAINIVKTWFITMPAAALVAFIIHEILRLLFLI